MPRLPPVTEHSESKVVWEQVKPTAADALGASTMVQDYDSFKSQMAMSLSQLGATLRPSFPNISTPYILSAALHVASALSFVVSSDEDSLEIELGSLDIEKTIKKLLPILVCLARIFHAADPTSLSEPKIFGAVVDLGLFDAVRNEGLKLLHTFLSEVIKHGRSFVELDISFSTQYFPPTIVYRDAPAAISFLGMLSFFKKHDDLQALCKHVVAGANHQLLQSFSKPFPKVFLHQKIQIAKGQPGYIPNARNHSGPGNYYWEIPLYKVPLHPYLLFPVKITLDPKIRKELAKDPRYGHYTGIGNLVYDRLLQEDGAGRKWENQLQSKRASDGSVKQKMDTSKHQLLDVFVKNKEAPKVGHLCLT